MSQGSLQHLPRGDIRRDFMQLRENHLVSAITVWDAGTILFVPLRAAEGMWPSADGTQLPRRRRALSQVSVLSGEAVSMWQEETEKPALLACRRAMWPGVRRASQMRLAYVSEELPSAG